MRRTDQINGLVSIIGTSVMKELKFVTLYFLVLPVNEFSINKLFSRDP